MTTQQLLALDLVIVVLSSALFFAAAGVTLSVRSGPGRVAGVAAASCAALAMLATAGRLMIVVLLLNRGWWFAADRIALSVPVAVLTAGFAAAMAGPVLIGGAVVRVAPRHSGGAALAFAAAPHRAKAGAALSIAGFGAATGLLVTFIIGYQLSVSGVVTVLCLLLGLSGLTWYGATGAGNQRNAHGHSGRKVGLIMLLVVPLITGAAAFYGDLQPVLIGNGTTGHAHQAAPTGAADGTGSTAAKPVSVADLRAPAERSRTVRRFTLTARQQTLTLPSGRTVDGWTFGSLPGPEIRVQQGDLVEVTLRNSDITDGVTLHWHGYPVPNGDDGVAGVTQDAVLPGGSFTYRFVAKDAGTYWYHTHQLSSEAVSRGLFGSLVVDPARGGVNNGTTATDLTLPVHTIDGITTVAGTDRVGAVAVAADTAVRLRLINTDSVPHRISVIGTPFMVPAVDGTDLNGPTPIDRRVLRIPAGGRYDVVFSMPDGPVQVGIEGAPATGMMLSPNGSPPTTTSPDHTAVAEATAGAPFADAPDLDLLTYGTPATVPRMTDALIDREATLVLDRQVRFLGGVPTFAHTVNGDVHPHVPPITVREGDVLRLTVVNRSSDTHPMHPHGHRVLVESRDGSPVTGSPIWLDTFDVRPGEVWVVLLRADNPGIWMAHCHNLEHATEGMVVHLVYEGVSTPYGLGGRADNRPE